MAKDHDGENQEPEGAFLTFSEKDGTVSMTTNIPDNLSRYALWMAGMEVMFRANTLADIRREMAKPQIITPGGAIARGLGILKG